MDNNLITYRVKGYSSIDLWAVSMSPDEIIERRSLLRNILRGTSWQNQSNAILDSIRLLPEGTSYLLEDEEGHCWKVCRSSGDSVTQEETEFRRVRAVMPAEYESKTGKDFDWSIYQKDTSEEKKLVNEFVLKFPGYRKKGMGLYIYSAAKGSGKTMLSCCILNELIRKYSVSVKFINAMDLLELTKKSYNGNEVEELEALYIASVLVIDDIGAQMSREWSNTVFYRIINARYNNRLVTIYTSNTECQALKMDERTTDRIESTTFPVQLPDEPIRSRNAAEKRNKIRESINHEK